MLETEAQAASLLEFGCDYAQGYLFSRPLGALAFLRLVQANDRLPVAGAPSLISAP